MRSIFICLSIVFVSLTGMAQDVTQVQPTIMIVPWSSKGEDLRTKIENDANYRTAIQVISNAFSQRGCSTKDFVTQLQNSLNDQTISSEKMNQTSLFKKVIEMSPTDYYIETEVTLKELSSGNSVEIRMNAIDKFTGDKISAEMMRSQPFRTDDWSKLVELALKDDGKLERFFSLVSNEFAKIREIGRTITVKVEVKETSVHRLDNEVGDDFDFLSDLIIDWVKENSYKNYSRTKGNTSTLLYFDEVKIPLRDESGMNYDINTFAKEMRKQMRRLGKITDAGELKVEQDIKGSNILFTIL
jgi:hypothetical protein